MAFSPVQPAHRALWSGLTTHDPAAELGILGVPFDGATSYRRGAAFAPARLRELTPHLSPCTEEGAPLRLRICDYGDVSVDLDWARYFAAVENQAIEVLRHPLTIFFGGDHSVTIPLMRAFHRTRQWPWGVLHVDAHPDLCDQFQGHHWSHACTARRALDLPDLAPEHLVLVGLRSFVPEEWEFLQSHPEILFFTARQCHRQGIEAVAQSVVRQLKDLEAVYLSLDIDVLDPAYAPGTGVPEGGGLTTRDLLELICIVFQELPVRAMDVVEVAPPLDSNDITSFAALKVIYEAWGAFQQKIGLTPGDAAR